MVTLEESRHIILLIIISALFIEFAAGLAIQVEVSTPVIIAPG